MAKWKIKKTRRELRQLVRRSTPWRLLRRVKTSMQKRLFKPRTNRLYDLVLQKGDARQTKRALLSYIVYPFSIREDDPRFLRHINIWHSCEMVRALNRLGYVVDVIEYTDAEFVPRKEYDLFIGHGGTNFVGIAQRLPERAIKIYFSTGCYWKFHNNQELARFAALRERKGVDLPLDRFINNSEEGALLTADGVIGIGNNFTRNTYAGFSPVIMLNGTSLSDDRYEQSNKNFDRGREHFLYFAGGGNVHKGLDLLLEAFSELDQHLWICSTIDPQFAKVYSDELQNHPNIHLVGWIQPRSIQFYELMDTCNYVILPSCSEGQAQSVVECINQGLIPVVSYTCGLNVDGYGVILDPCTIEAIAKVIPVLASYPVAQCHEMSIRAHKAAIADFSEAAFRRSLTDAIQHVISLSSQNPKDFLKGELHGH